MWWFCACVNVTENLYLRFLRKDAGSFARRVLTRPNSCMTLSSCLRSSWPFNRNMNSWPLLPADGATNTALIHCSKLCNNHYVAAWLCAGHFLHQLVDWKVYIYVLDELWHQLKQKHFQHDTYLIVPLSYTVLNVLNRPLHWLHQQCNCPNFNGVKWYLQWNQWNKVPVLSQVCS